MKSLVLAVVVCFSLSAWAQSSEPKPNAAPPHSPAEVSSSRDSIIDLSPPLNDERDHPHSSRAVEDVSELSGYNPLRALKCIEIGNYYFDQHNYGAAESRYLEAILWNDHDAEARWRLALVEEKLGKPGEARRRYEEYLQILPRGPHAKEALKALERLAKATQKAAAQPSPAK